MNDATQSATVQSTAQRNRAFGRTYNHDTGTVEITSAFDKDFKFTGDLNKIPENVIRGAALQWMADYMVGEANDALKDEAIGDEAARRAKALETLNEAYQELVEGKVDFRSGVGLGGARTAIGSLGTVLFNLGKTYVVNAKGEKLSFNDVNGARAAVKALYLDTDVVTKPDPRGGVVVDPKTKAERPRTIEVTSRMIFNAIQAIPEVKAALEAMRKPKPKELGVGTVLG